jgi:hypothetical protein
MAGLFILLVRFDTRNAMNRLLRIAIVLVLLPQCLAATGGSSRADERDPGSDDRLGLADLAGYRMALTGKATADDARSSDPPARASFRDLWERPDAFRGRRVTIKGRVERIFRQGPVGSFPPLAEVWLTSPAGDPFCVVFPLPGTAPTSSTVEIATTPPERSTVPDPGRDVQFTGTFLKTVRYAGGDRARLAPLVVGERPPRPVVDEAGNRVSPATNPNEVLRAIGGTGPHGIAGLDRGAWSATSWALGMTLAVIATGVLAWQHLRKPGAHGRAALPDQRLNTGKADPPLLFLDVVDESRV